jgi:hypothetical protein
VPTAFGAFPVAALTDRGEAELAKHGKHQHSDQEQRDALDQHLKTKPREIGAFFDGANRVAGNSRAETLGN